MMAGEMHGIDLSLFLFWSASVPKLEFGALCRRVVPGALRIVDKIPCT